MERPNPNRGRGRPKIGEVIEKKSSKDISKNYRNRLADEGYCYMNLLLPKAVVDAADEIAKKDGVLRRNQVLQKALIDWANKLSEDSQ